jgi:hypothetical protein
MQGPVQINAPVITVLDVNVFALAVPREATYLTGHTQNLKYLRNLVTQIQQEQLPHASQKVMNKTYRL